MHEQQGRKRETCDLYLHSVKRVGFYDIAIQKDWMRTQAFILRPWINSSIKTVVSKKIKYKLRKTVTILKWILCLLLLFWIEMTKYLVLFNVLLLHLNILFLGQRKPVTILKLFSFFITILNRNDYLVLFDALLLFFFLNIFFLGHNRQIFRTHLCFEYRKQLRVSLSMTSSE